MKPFRTLLSFAVPAAICIVLINQLTFSATYSGKVIDHQSKVPVQGALVSLGYSLYRTTTDSAGHFSLDIPADAILPRDARTPLAPKISIIWNTRHRTVDLSNAGEIKVIALYRLNGTSVFRKTIRFGEKIAPLPNYAPGVYLAVFTRLDNSIIVEKLMSTSGQGIQTISAASNTARLQTTAAATNNMTFIFRHDNFIPADRIYSAPSDNMTIEMNADPRAYVFDQSNIRSYYFTVTREDSLSMERNAQAEEWVPAQFTYNNASYGRVGLRYKGSVYTIPRCFDTAGTRAGFPECRNISLKVKFNEYNDSLRFYEMKKLNLHAMLYDDGKLREMLAYQVYRDMGIYTCRTAFAKVYVNGVFRGLFTAVEDVDGRFTSSRWPGNGDGNLYKEAWPFRLNATYYREALRTNDKPEDSASVTGMVNFYRAINNATPETFVATVRPFMDFDYFLRYIVVDRAIHNTDGIMTWYVDGTWKGNHNYYFYEEEKAKDRYWLIPWDLNITFSETDEIVDGFGLPDWNVAPDTCSPVEVWGGSMVLPPNCDKLTRLTAQTLWPDFVKLGDQFLDSIFTVEKLKKSVDRLAKLIDPIMQNEPTVGYTAWKKQVVSIGAIIDGLPNGFRDYLHGTTPAIDTSGYTTPFPGDSGLMINRLNNFEFDTSVSIAPWCSTETTDSSSITLSLNTVSPLYGTADMLARFVFRPYDSTKTYAEWAYTGFLFGKKIDCTSLKQISMDLRCDTPRYCFVHLLSSAYDTLTTSPYGWYGVVTAKTRRYIFDLGKIAYPSWADPNSPDIIDSVLANVTGIGINPNARFSDDGKLKVNPDSGYIHIDNIRFGF